MNWRIACPQSTKVIDFDINKENWQIIILSVEGKEDVHYISLYSISILYEGEQWEEPMMKIPLKEIFLNVSFIPKKHENLFFSVISEEGTLQIYSCIKDSDLSHSIVKSKAISEHCIYPKWSCGLSSMDHKHFCSNSALQ